MAKTLKPEKCTDLVGVLGDGDAQLLPADADRLHGVLGVPVLEDHGLLDLLVDVLQLVDVGLEADERLLHLLELLELLLQALHVHGRVGDLVVLPLDPRAAHVRLLREQYLSSEFCLRNSCETSAASIAELKLSGMLHSYYYEHLGSNFRTLRF